MKHGPYCTFLNQPRATLLDKVLKWFLKWAKIHENLAKNKNK